MRTDTQQQRDWSGSLEQLEDRLFMSADPLGGLLGGSIQHHAIVENLPPAIEHHATPEQPPALEHHLSSEADFWIDHEKLNAIDEELGRIEQSLANAHDQSGLTQVRSDYGFDGTGQTVAVIDSGIAYDHFALGGGFGSNYRVVGGWDFTGENDANPYDDGGAGSHGTHVSGIIGASGGTHTGVAPGVDLVGLRVFDDVGNGYFSWVENALDWVHTHRNSFENPITAVNLSLGVASWNADTIPNWANLEDEFAQLEADGIFVAVSAGNSYTSFNEAGLSYPAASPYVIPVASVDDSGLLSYFSQRNSRVIAAPGRGIISTVPDYAGNNNGTVDDYASFSGTSMASPYVAGASVIIREAMEFAGYTNITQDTIYNHMIATADSFYDSETNANYNRLNLESAIDALMPADDYGSTVETAYDLGTISASISTEALMSGAITTLDDTDYFKFTAGSNGTVSFTASNITHNLGADWDVTGGTGTWSGANNETLTLDVVAGQEYTVGFSSDDGLGYYDLGVVAESTFSYTDWGSISFTELQGVSISGENWFRVAADSAGYFTTEALFDAAGGQINLELYNASFELIDSGNAVAGESRVDYYGAAGDELYIKAIGSNSDVDFRLTNLVSVNGTAVQVTGTSGDDAFTFTAGTNHLITINGVDYSFASIAIAYVNFDGGAGNDSASITGTSQYEVATLQFGSVAVMGTGFSVDAENVEDVEFNGLGGNDRAYLYDSTGNDIFTISPRNGTVQGEGFEGRVTDIYRIFAYASEGYDKVYLHDSAGNDYYWSDPDAAKLYGSNFHNRAEGFDRTYAYSTAGNDKAYFYDSAGNDYFWADSNVAKAYGSGFHNLAEGFSRTYAYSTGGNDKAYLYDSTGNDYYWADPNVAKGYGAGFHNRAEGFSRTYAYSTGGNDKAYLYDSAGNDYYWADPNVAKVYGAGFHNRAEGFSRTYAYSTGGNDKAYLYDSAGNDYYWADSNVSKVYGSGFHNRAEGFSKNYAFASQGYDRATIYSDNLSDQIYGRDNYANLALEDSNLFVNDFDKITLVDESGLLTEDVDATDYLFSLLGG